MNLLEIAIILLKSSNIPWQKNFFYARLYPSGALNNIALSARPSLSTVETTRESVNEFYGVSYREVVRNVYTYYDMF
jgi:hypothetical protein